MTWSGVFDSARRSLIPFSILLETTNCGAPKGDETCSYEKIKSVFEVCEKCGVKTNPSEEIPVENQGENARQAVFIAPVHSWYEQEFDTEGDAEAPG